jgi:hypothetical protein
VKEEMKAESKESSPPLFSLYTRWTLLEYEKMRFSEISPLPTRLVPTPLFSSRSGGSPI